MGGKLTLLYNFWGASSLAMTLIHLLAEVHCALFVYPLSDVH